MKKLIPLFLVLGILLTSCNSHRHFISDRQYRKLVSEQYEKQKKLASNRSDQLFKVMDGDLTLCEREAMMFLYAFMPLSDLADYTGDFYLANVRASLAARDTFSWGKTVPEELFRHFVLPIRVNNENLDTARMAFFRELTPRIRNMSMKEAVLEINHWCHEKVTYRGTDIRTSSPLSTMKTAYGRCGEESTFTVAALRAAGIPARQCYTPRWAHCDDNHAWVEVWADGKWYFIGACEPEPDLNMAWFTAPAKRAMLVNTNVFGVYQGPEDALVKDERFTRINILSNYTDVKRIYAKVVDQKQQPVDSAIVEFQLYNYAEFYALHRTATGKDGLASLLTGKGDLLLWASKDGKFGFAKADVRTMDTVLIVLDKTKDYTASVSFDLVPPVKQEVTAEVSDSARNINTDRLAFEDKQRAAYESTFIDSLKAYRAAEAFGLNRDTLWRFLRQSRGNWRDLMDFISAVPAKDKKWIFPLLGSISEKDLRDVNPLALKDHLAFARTYEPLAADEEMFVKFILNPRFDNEFLKPWRQYFQGKFDKNFIESARKDPQKIFTWVKENIRVDNNANYGKAPITPVGVYELRVSDQTGQNMLFTALCRSFGIPARIETATRLPQYYFDGKWNDVWFAKQAEAGNERATLMLQNDPANQINPEYYIHYTVEQLKDGFYRSLDYETDPSVKAFPCSLQILPGSYLVVTGNRVGDGTVLASLNFFTLPVGAKKEATITLRKDVSPLPVYGKVDLSKYLTTPSKSGLILAYIEPDKEPTKHLLADLVQKRSELSTWKGRIIIVCPTEKEMKDFTAKHAKELPANCSYNFLATFPIDNIRPLLKTSGKSLPAVVFINPAGEVNFISEGYRIGTGDELVKMAMTTAGEK
ncbi:MAG TPA: transglutaminase-like domain-containing protein [Bacteroidales bacterium]|mgnify:CR=1 FL=1|nr:transglutaminase-like domain-containing protein [Bacteroidales bacterium]HPS73268.1 transglutaminase-like domain-containing protein [Bacteroidales bacterium]